MKLIYTLLLLVLLMAIPITGSFAQNYGGAGTTFPGCGTNGCHNVPGREQYTTWVVTGHAVAYDSIGYIQQNPACLPCHTTGWDTLLTNGGFDDFFPPVTPNDSAGVQKMKNVQCESCHGPVQFGLNHPPDPASLQASQCGACHQGEHHPTLSDWGLSLHAVAKNTSIPGFEWISSNRQCAACHTAEGFMQFVNQPGYIPDVDPPGQAGADITCAACHDPHSSTNHAQLRMPVTELCQKCHNPEFDPGQPPPVGEEVHHSTAFMFDGVGGFEFAGYTYPNSAHTTVVTEKCVTCHVSTTEWAVGFPAYTGHTFDPRGEPCLTCHVDFDTTAHSFDYRGIQTEIEDLLATLNDELAAASPSDSLTEVFAQAKFNHDFVEADGSFGIHNTEYARALLESAIMEFTPTVDVELETDVVPREFALNQNYPNPFNPATVIGFSVPKQSAVQLDVYDILGRHIRSLVNENIEPGSYHVRWDGRDENGQPVISGIYFYKFSSESFEMTRKMIMLK